MINSNSPFTPYIDIHTHNEVDREDIYNPPSVGIHPWFIDSKTIKDDFLELTSNAEDVHFRVIGEAGLDKLCKTPIKIQMEVFIKQIELTERLNKPLIIHCVKAYSEILSLHKKLNPKAVWILHGFNSSIETAQQYLERGIFLSCGELLFDSRSKVARIFNQLPLNRIFLETDDQVRYDIAAVYAKAAQIHNIPVDILKNDIYSNFCAIFGDLKKDTHIC